MSAVSAADTNNQADSVSSDDIALIEISGQVSQCSNGQPFPGATITVKDKGTAIASTTTSSDGTYYLSFQSKKSVFTVTASANGHKPSTQTVTINKSNPETYAGTANFKLGANDAYVYQGWASNPDEDYSFSDGTTIHLTGASNAFTTISDAIDWINTGNTVYIAPGTYNEYSMSIGKSINLHGEDQATTIIDAEGNARILTIWNNTNVNIEQLTFRDGASENGGAVRVESGTVTINGCTFDSNTVTYDGGAICVDPGATVTISGSSFTDNTAIFYGGAIVNYGTLNLEDCSFTSNTANNAGGAITNFGTFTCNDCTFTSNTANDFCGGAIAIGYLRQTFQSTVQGCTFTNNSVISSTGYGGGAIYVYSQSLTANYNRFYNNIAHQGSAIFCNAALANVENNWWGSNNPTFSSLIYGASAPTQWLFMTISANPTTINNGVTSLITVSFNNYKSDGTNPTAFTPVNSDHIPDGTPVIFSLINGPFGILTQPLTVNTLGGLASILFTASNVGVQDVNGTLDNQQRTASITINPATFVNVYKEFRDSPWGNDITTAKFHDVVYAMVQVQNAGPDSTSLTLLDTLAGITWTGNYYVLSGSINPSEPTNWVFNDVVNTFDGTQWNIPTFSSLIGGNVKWLAIECIINKVGTVSNFAQVVGQSAYPYQGFDNYTASIYVPSADLYIIITSNKGSTVVGEQFTVKYKLGNRGPDDAEKVTITIPLPEGFVVDKIEGDGTWQIVGNKIIWTFDLVKVGDPDLYVTGRTTIPGVFSFGASIASETFNINSTGVNFSTVNVLPEASAATQETVGMQTTGIPLPGIVLAIFMVMGGFISTRKKQ